MKLLKRVQDTKVVIGPVRLTYCHVQAPYNFNEDDARKYQTGILIPKEETEAVKVIQDAIKEAENQALSGVWGGKKPKDYKSPLRDGDDRDDDETFQGHYYLTAKSNQHPNIQDRHGNDLKWEKNADGEYVLEEEDLLYSGIWVFISFRFFAVSKGKKPVCVGLDNVRIAKDDTPLGGRSSANSDFGEAEIDDDDL